MATRRPDDEPSGLPPEWAGFVVPDDISELEPEIEAVRGELAGPRPPGRLRRVFETRRWQRYGLSGPLAAAVLLVVLLFASLVFLLLPTAPRAPAARPLARPAVAPGQVGGLLPDLALPLGRYESVRLRNLRPAVLILVPARCECSALLIDVIDSSTPSRLQVLFVGESGDPTLPGTAPADRVHAGADSGGRIAALYHAGSGPTVLFVRSDGVVTRVIRDAGPGADIHSEISALAG